MATTSSRPAALASTPRQPADRKRKEKRTDIWSSLLRQTRQAQARNRSNAASRRQLVVCGGSPEDQRQFLQSLTRPPPPAPPSRNRDQREQKPKGQLNLSNRYAYGYGHVTLFSPAQGGALGQEAEEAARLEVHTVGEAEGGYEGVLERVLKPKVEENADAEDAQDAVDMGLGPQTTEPGRRPAVAILLSWKEPWTFLAKLRAWLQLLAKAVEPSAKTEEDVMDILKESRLSVNVVVQHTEAQVALDREGWQEETFDYISQILRTATLPLHPLSSLVFTSSTAPPQQPGTPLTECQKIIFQSLGFDLTILSPKQNPSGTPAKSEDLQPKHNVVDRMNLVVPQGWDSMGKIRLLSENFSPEEVLTAWQADLSHPVFRTPSPAESDPTRPAPSPQTNGGATRDQSETEIYEAASSPPAPSSPTSPSNPSTPSAINTYETTILDPTAHKRPLPPSITTTTRPEQTFLREMKSELDALALKDTKPPTSTRTTSSLGMPTGESTGALSDLGDVRYNVGGVSYNAAAAEAAIERLRRAPSTSGRSGSVQSGAGPAATSSSPVPGASRTTTPRPPRREREEREVSGASGSGGKTGGGDFPSEDLEAYFASLAKKAGGGSGEGSRSATPGRG